MSQSKGGKTIKVRLSAEQLARLQAHADRLAFNGLSGVLRALAFENLARKEEENEAELRRKAQAADSFRRQMGGN
jgi:hypothetical protein